MGDTNPVADLYEMYFVNEFGGVLSKEIPLLAVVNFFLRFMLEIDCHIKSRLFHLGRLERRWATNLRTVGFVWLQLLLERPWWTYIVFIIMNFFVNVASKYKIMEFANVMANNLVV
jgi:hypothetical protein